MLNGARGRSDGGEGFCPQGPARRGASPPWSQIEDLVFQVLTGVGVGDSSAPPTQWDRGNRQVPSGKSHGAGRILTTNDIFGLTRRAGVPAGRGYSRVDRAVDEVICSLIAEDPVEGVLIHRHVTTILRVGPVPFKVLFEAWPSVEALGRFKILSPLIAEVAL